LKFLPLVWAGLWRRPARTIFTGLCIVIAFLLLGLLQGINAGFDRAIADAYRDFLITDTRVRGGTQFPVAAMATIRAIPGVTKVTMRAYFTGWQREPNDGLAALATEIPVWFDVRPGFAIEEKYLDTVRATRSAMVMTPFALKAMGLKIGQTVTLKSTIQKSDGSYNWEFTIAGTFDTVNEPSRAMLGLIRYDYLDEYRVKDKGTAERFFVRIADPNKAIATAAAIDKIFENSPHETRTRSSEARAESQAKQMGDVAFFTNAVMAAVLFTLAFLTGNTVRQSLTDRLPEFAVLKAMGYASSRLLALAFTESLLLCLPPALAGIALAALARPLLRNDYVVILVSGPVFVLGASCAALLALLSVAMPSWTLARLSIAAALGKRT